MASPPSGNGMKAPFIPTASGPLPLVDQSLFLKSVETGSPLAFKKLWAKDRIPFNPILHSTVVTSLPLWPSLGPGMGYQSNSGFDLKSNSVRKTIITGPGFSYWIASQSAWPVPDWPVIDTFDQTLCGHRPYKFRIHFSMPPFGVRKLKALLRMIVQHNSFEISVW